MNDDRGVGSGLIPPDCCGDQMVLVASGRAANFDIGLWRCLTCEVFEQTSIRTDGEIFWVGAMGRAIHREQLRVIDRAYRGCDDLQ